MNLSGRVLMVMEAPLQHGHRYLDRPDERQRRDERNFSTVLVAVEQQRRDMVDAVEPLDQPIEVRPVDRAPERPAVAVETSVAIVEKSRHGLAHIIAERDGVAGATP